MKKGLRHTNSFFKAHIEFIRRQALMKKGLRLVSLDTVIVDPAFGDKP